MNKLLGRKIYFAETRSGKRGWYIGKVLGFKHLMHKQSSLFAPDKSFPDTRLLILTSDRRKITEWESNTFEVYK